MTVREWKKQNPDTTHTRVWAADSFGGFGLKGHSVYGLPRLHLWDTERWGPCPSETWYEVRYCGDLYTEQFSTVAEARRRASALKNDGEDDTHIVRVDAA